MGELQLVKQLKDRPALRRSFDALAQSTFGISFEAWHAAGWWGGRYIPYALADGDAVVANVSVNRMDFLWQGRRRRYIQLGTVMTARDRRGQGLARRLLTEVLRDWQGRCDGIYLFANQTVLGFYPRFGFERAAEYQYSLPLAPGPGGARLLDTDIPQGRAELLRCYQLGNPFARLGWAENPGLLMFYCGGPLRGCVYALPALGAVAVADTSGPELLCYDVFGGQGHTLAQVLAALAQPHTQSAVLGFTPRDSEGGVPGPAGGDDDALFILTGGENLFSAHRAMFPLLTHA